MPRATAAERQRTSQILQAAADLVELLQRRIMDADIATLVQVIDRTRMPMTSESSFSKARYQRPCPPAPLCACGRRLATIALRKCLRLAY